MFNFFSNKKHLNTISEALYEYILNSSLIFASLVTNKFKADYTEAELHDFIADCDKQEITHGLYVLNNETAFEATMLLLHILDRVYLPKVDKKNADYLYDDLTKKLFSKYAARLLPAYEANEAQIYNMLIERINERVNEYFKSTVGVKDTIDVIVKYGELLAVQVKKAEQKKLATYGTKEEEKEFDDNWLTDLARVRKHAAHTQMEAMSFFSTTLKEL